MTPFTNTLLSVAGQSGAIAGHWFQTWNPDRRTHHLIDVVLSAGTATWNIEGRTSPDDSPVIIATNSASIGQLLAKYPQVRINVTAAAGATILAKIDKPALDTGS